MKRLIFISLLILSCIPTTAQVSFGKAMLLNDGWQFQRGDTTWRNVTLPHDWSVELPMSPDKASCQGYLPGGKAWYRRELPIIEKGMEGWIYFEGIYSHSEVYLNGHLLGKRPSGFASFLYHLTPFINKDGINMLTVSVDHSEDADSRWYTGSGINRDVWLVTAPPVHLALWGTAYRLKSINSRKAELDVDIETTDDRTDKTPLNIKAEVKLKDADGNVVAKTTTPIGSKEKKTVRLTISNPQRWTLQQPYLYTLESKIVVEGSKDWSDCSTVRVGLRTLEFSPNQGFALNGQWMKVKGVCLHDDAGCLGTAVPREVWRQRLTELKRIGVNAIRMSHNPHAPMLYDLCDEMGLLVMDEASDEWELPKRKWLKGWNKGRPGYQGTYTYFEEWIDRDVADMVRRDRCHPSVFMWSIGNEVDYPNDPYTHPVLDGGEGGFTQPMYGGYKPDQPNAERIGEIAQRLASVVRSIDTSRPVTGALAGVVMSNATSYPQVVDVVGYNYTESRYQEDHRNYPDRIIYGSENRHDLQAWLAVSQNDHIFGQFLWTGIDYLGESGPWPARGSTAGLLDLKGERKPIGHYRAALWSEAPVCYIGTIALPSRMGRNNRNRRFPSWMMSHAPNVWNYDEGQRVRVVCYTNAATARLTLNGQTVDAEARRDPDSNIIYWDIDYAPGTLLCETDNGASHELKTSGQPQALRMSCTPLSPADRVAIIYVEAVDSNGTPVRLADNEVTLHIDGPARLLGMENGDIMNCQPVRQAPFYDAPQRLRLHGGRLAAYIQITGKAAPVTVRATSVLLQQAESQINL